MLSLTSAAIAISASGCLGAGLHTGSITSNSALNDAACTLKNTILVIGGVRAGGGVTSDRVYSSANGISWTSAGTLPQEMSGGMPIATTENGTAKLAFVGGINTAGTVLSTIFTGSLDGSGWTASAHSIPDERAFFSGVYFNNKYYIYGGYDSTQAPTDSIFSSADGLNWTTEATPLPADMAGHNAIVFKGAVYIYGGADGTWVSHKKIYKSTDGVNFSLLAGPKELPAERLFATPNVIEFGGKLYIYGGMDDLMLEYNTVWSSTDGENWTVETSNFPARAEHVVYVADGAVWIIGGYTGSGATFLDSVLKSTDGLTFNQVGTIPRPLYASTVPVLPSCN